jgi:N-methylhydantoinase B
MKLVAARTVTTMRQRVRELPDGTYSAESYLDYDGVTKDFSPLIRLSITVAGDALEVGFKGSSPATRGPVNIPFIGSRSAVRAALKGVLFPRDETNYGHFDPIVCVEDKGLITSPQRPSPTDSYGYAACAIMNLVSRAMYDVAPERCSADAYQLFGCYLYRVDERDGKPFIFIEPIDGGHGARPSHDGPTLIFWADGDTPNMPVEVLETRFPIRCERSALMHEAGGHGTFRGGAAVRREFRVLEDGIYLQTIIEGTKDPARGLAGGGQAHGGVIVVRPGTQREEFFQSRLSFYGPLSQNEVVRVQSGGGGGLGLPDQRDPAMVRSDVTNATMTLETAKSIYGLSDE